MKFDKETIVVILIAAALTIGWLTLYPKYMRGKAVEAARIEQQMSPAPAAAPASAPAAAPVATPAQAPVPEQTAAAPAAPAEKAVPAATPADVPEKPQVSTPELTLSNDLIRVVLDTETGSIRKAELLKYKNAHNEDMVSGLDNAPHSTFETNLSEYAKLISAEGKVNGETALIRKTWSNGLVEECVYTLKDYSIRLELRLSNPSKAAITIPREVVWVAGVPPTRNLAGDRIYSERHRVDICLRGASSPEDIDPTAKEAKFNGFAMEKAVDWAGSTNKYFASLLFDTTGKNSGTVMDRSYHQDTFNPKDKFVVPAVGIVTTGIVINPGLTEVQNFQYYFGPKEFKRIKQMPPSVMEAMHISYFSWFEFIARPMVRLLVWLNSIFHSYGISIIVLTLLVRIIFFPVTQKANNSMRKMQKLKPKMDALRAKYKDNPQEMNLKMMEMYREEKVSPMGGCLPILLQIPVFIALYSALDSAVELRQVSFLWATDLAKPDLVGPQITLPFLGAVGLHPLVIMQTILMVVQQKMTPSQMDPAQQKVMMLMPIIMLVMLYNLPSGLTLYWTVSQIFSILQMKYGMILAKREEDAAEAAKKNRKAIKS